MVAVPGRRDASGLFHEINRSDFCFSLLYIISDVKR